MRECERCRVQEVAIQTKRRLRLRGFTAAWRVGAASLGRETDNGGRAVERVADNRMPERRHVDADLVGSSGLDAHGYQRETAEGRLDAAEHPIVADSSATIVAACCHPRAADRIAGDGGIYGSAFGGNCAVDQSDVGLLHLATGEHIGQLGMGLVMLGHQQQTAGLLVEPMHDAGTEGSTMRMRAVRNDAAAR